MDRRTVLSVLSLANYPPAILLGIVLFLSAGVGSADNSAEDHCLAFVLEG
jgi:hypothetical protein